MHNYPNPMFGFKSRLVSISSTAARSEVSHYSYEYEQVNMLPLHGVLLVDSALKHMCNLIHLIWHYFTDAAHSTRINNKRH